jgi:hypothetical protein
MIRSDNRGTTFTTNLRVTTATASGIKHAHSQQLIQSDTSLRLERRAIFIIMRHFERRPLVTKTLQMLITDESRNPINNSPAILRILRSEPNAVLIQTQRRTICRVSQHGEELRGYQGI